MREPDFELSADMRLLELQRDALGLPARERLSWESRTGAEGSVPVPQPPVQAGRSAVLSIEAAAFPATGVIAGAVVTLSLSASNEGAIPAEEIFVATPLPGGAAYRPGTFVWNGRSTFDDVAETFFGEGLAIGALAPGERASFQWKIGVRLGTKALVIAPRAHSTNAAVVGARPIVIARKEQAASAFGAELGRADTAAYEPKPLIPVEIPATELPIYELDEEEALVYEAADAALSTAAPKAARIAEPAPAEPAPAEPAAPAAAPEPAEPTELAVPAVPAEALEPQPPPREAVLLFGRFERATVAFFERIFEGNKPPTILQHCIFGGALACTMGPREQDAAGLKRHLDAQSGILHRIVLHERLGKKEPIAEYAGELLATLDALRAEPVDVAPPPSSKEALALTSELSEPTLAVIARIAQERARWDFVKARQLTLALQAQTIAGDRVDPALRSQIEAALRAYAQASVSILQKLFVRIRIDRTTALLLACEPTLDTAARSLIAGFKRAMEDA